MASKYRYNVSATSNVDLSAQVRAYRSEASMNAEEGSVAISTFYIDDESGGLNIIGHRTFFWSEESASSNTKTILHGFVADRDISRGPFKVLNSRQWAVNVTDPNTLLGRPIMRGTDANRPAETDVARVQWLMTTGEMNLITDSTYVSTSGPVAMDAVDYRDQTVLSILDDCAQASGKNYFVFRNEFLATPALGLWYDFASSTAYTSSVRLTNVLADVDSTTTYAVFNDDLKLNRDPSRVYSSVLVPYDGGEVFVTDDSIRLAFARRDTTAPSVNVKSAAKAQARALRYLDDIATEEDRLTMSYLVPLARVNQLREGQRFQAKFSHLPDYEDWRYLRVLKRTVLAISEEFYKVTIEATPGTVVSTVSCASVLSGLTQYDSGSLSGGPPCSVSPSTPSANPALTLTFMVMAQDDTCIGPPIVSANLTVSGFTEVQKYSGGPGACDHSLLMVASKATTGGSPGAMTCNFTGNGAENYRAIGFSLPTSQTTPVQVAQQNGSGSIITLPATPTPGNLLVMFRECETNNFTASPGVGWTLIGSQVKVRPGAISEHIMDVWVHCVQAGDGTTYGNGDASFSHYSFLSEWAFT